MKNIRLWWRVIRWVRRGYNTTVKKSRFPLCFVYSVCDSSAQSFIFMPSELSNSSISSFQCVYIFKEVVLSWANNTVAGLIYLQRKQFQQTLIYLYLYSINNKLSQVIVKTGLLIFLWLFNENKQTKKQKQNEKIIEHRLIHCSQWSHTGPFSENQCQLKLYWTLWKLLSF